MQQHDPYESIKGVLTRELQHITGLQADLFAGHPAAAQQLDYAFRDVSEQLSELEAAVQRMVQNPAKYQLSPTTAYMRQVEVETMRFQLSDLQTTCAQVETSSSGRTSQKGVDTHQTTGTNGHVQHLKGNGGGSNSSSMRPAAAPPIRHSKLVQHHPLRTATNSSSSMKQPPDPSGLGAAAASSCSSAGMGGKPLPQTAAAAAAGTRHSNNNQPAGFTAYSDDTRDTDTGWDSYEGVVQQQVVQQDAALDHISLHVEHIKHTGLAMQDELEEQSLLLHGLQEDTDSSHLKLRGLRKKVAQVIQQSRRDKQLMLIVVLSVLLVILTVLALA